MAHICIVMFVAMYAPYSWLLWIDYGQFSVVKMWPAMPMLFPAALVNQALAHGWELDELPAIVLLSIVAAVLFMVFTWLGTRGRFWLIDLAAAVLTLSAINSWILHNAFLA